MEKNNGIDLNNLSRYVLLAIIGIILGGPSVVAQGNTVTHDSNNTATSAKLLAFEVVSIRPSDPQSHGNGLKITQDGYRMLHSPLLWQIMNAYPPQIGATAFTLDHVKGYPAWLTTERYDIDARVSEADQVEWQKPAVQPVMLRAMMRQMFTERCRLEVHREVKEGDVYLLVVGKNGSKLKATDPSETPPPGTLLSDGGVLSQDRVTGAMILHGAPIRSFLALIAANGGAGRPIQDNTGLTGIYDFTDKPTNATDSAPSQQQDGVASATDPEPSLSSFVKKLGLELIPAKGPVETLVIDHVERPSAN